MRHLRQHIRSVWSGGPADGSFRRKNPAGPRARGTRAPLVRLEVATWLESSFHPKMKSLLWGLCLSLALAGLSGARPEVTLADVSGAYLKPAGLVERGETDADSLRHMLVSLAGLAPSESGDPKSQEMDGLLTDDLFGIPDTLLVLQVVQGSNVVPLGLGGEVTVGLTSSAVAPALPGPSDADFLALERLSAGDRARAFEAGVAAAGCTVSADGESLVLPNGASLPLGSEAGRLLVGDLAGILRGARKGSGIAQGLVVSMQAVADAYGPDSAQAAGAAEALRQVLREAGGSDAVVVVATGLEAGGATGAEELARWRAAQAAAAAPARRALQATSAGRTPAQWTTLMVAVLVALLVAVAIGAGINALVNMPLVKDTLLYSKSKVA